MVKKLNDKHKLFCLEYLKDQNATRAYKEIYKCSDTVANTSGPRLLVNVCIKEYLDKKKNELLNKTQISVEYVVEGLKEIAEYGRQLTEEGKMQDANVSRSALQDLGKHLKMFTENHDHKVDIVAKVVSLPPLDEGQRSSTLEA